MQADAIKNPSSRKKTGYDYNRVSNRSAFTTVLRLTKTPPTVVGVVMLYLSLSSSRIYFGIYSTMTRDPETSSG